MNRPSVLCLEDEPKSGAGMCELLSSGNGSYPILLASSGDQAIEIARRRPIGVLLADIQMPGPIDGIDAAREIQQLHPYLRTVFVTAYKDNHKYQQRVIEANLNVSAWIDKPLVNFRRHQLRKTVRAEMDMRLMHDLVRAWSCAGWSLSRALESLPPLLAVFQIPQETFQDFVVQINPETPMRQITSEILSILSEVRRAYEVIEERQIAFAHFKNTGLVELGRIHLGATDDTRRMALLIKMALRQMKGIEISKEQLDSLEYALEKLGESQAVSQDRRDCRRRFQRVGIHMMMDLGPKARDLVKLYDEDYDEDSEVLR